VQPDLTAHRPMVQMRKNYRNALFIEPIKMIFMVVGQIFVSLSIYPDISYNVAINLRFFLSLNWSF
jgi:hypothetical protein